MDTVNKELALKLLIEKQQNQFITYEHITRETGYSERQLIRLVSYSHYNSYIIYFTQSN